MVLLIKNQQQQTKMKNSSLKALVRPHHCKKLGVFPPSIRKKRNPASPDYSQLAQNPLEAGSFYLVPSEPTTSRAHAAAPGVRVSARKSQMQRRQTLRGEQRAQGQGKTWSGVAATSAARIQGRALFSAFAHPW